MSIAVCARGEREFTFISVVNRDGTSKQSSRHVSFSEVQWQYEFETIYPSVICADPVMFTSLKIYFHFKEREIFINSLSTGSYYHIHTIVYFLLLLRSDYLLTKYFLVTRILGHLGSRDRKQRNHSRTFQTRDSRPTVASINQQRKNNSMKTMQFSHNCN